MQIVNTKLPNENIQTYQPQMMDSGGGGVNYQRQIVIKLPNGTTKMAKNDSEQPILPNSQLFQSCEMTKCLNMSNENDLDDSKDNDIICYIVDQLEHMGNNVFA